MSNQSSNIFKEMLWKGQITALTDTFKIILLQPGFVFNKDTHKGYAEVVAAGGELPTANGYTVGGVALAGIVVDHDPATDQGYVTWNNVTWYATTGSLLTSGAIIFDDSTATPGDDHTDVVVSYKDAGGTLTAVAGTPIIITGIKELIYDAT